MIKIFSKAYNKSVQFLSDKIETQGELCDTLIATSSKSIAEFLKSAITENCKALFLVGNVGDSATTFAEIFGLTMFYDKFVEKNIREYCKLTQI